VGDGQHACGLVIAVEVELEQDRHPIRAFVVVRAGCAPSDQHVRFTRAKKGLAGVSIFWVDEHTVGVVKGE